MPRLLILGDSIMKGVIYSEERRRHTMLSGAARPLQVWLEQAGFEIEIRARFGATSRQVLREAEKSGARIWYATTKAPRMYTEVEYRPGDYLMFGPETRGLPETLLQAHPERCVRIPMQEAARSLNLSNSVAILLFEALRQNDFAGLSGQGKMAGAVPESN